MIKKYQNLTSVLPKTRKAGLRNGQVEAHRAACPCCTANMPVSTALTIDGVILLNSFCSCEIESILQAVSLEFTDILPDQQPHHARTSVRTTDWKSVAALAEAVTWAAAIAANEPSESNLAAVVGYADALHRAAKQAMRGGAR